MLSQKLQKKERTRNSLSQRLQRVVVKDGYLREWREDTAYCLLALGIPEVVIENALTGHLDRQHCSIVCKLNNISFHKVWAIIKLLIIQII